MARPIIRRLALTFSAVVLVIIGVVTYAVYTESDAEQRAKNFCASMKLGGSAERLLQLAKSRGADERQTRWIRQQNEDPWLPVTFIGFTPLSRHICSIRATDTIKSFEYVYLD